MTILNNFRLFFGYLANPIVPQRVDRIKSVRFFLVLFLCSIVVDSLLEYVTSSKYLVDTLQINNIDTLSEYIYSQGFVFAIIVAGVIVPFIEELTQRYYLTSFIWNSILLPLFLCFIVIELFHIRDIVWLSIFVGVCSVFSITIFLKIRKSNKYKYTFLRYYKKKFIVFFYISAIAFGVAHIGNYEIRHFVPVIPILLVVPQILGGVLLGYIRISMGLRWSIAFHSLHNLVSVAVLFITHQH